MAKKILTKVKHIYFTPWLADDSGLDTSTGAKLELKNVVADTVAISQDDPETNTIDCETRDEPIIEATTLGKYTLTMDSADIDLDILVKCLGFTKVGTKAAVAPSSYTAKYAYVEIEFDKDKMVLPRILVTSKIDASSLKTDVAKGTISGTGFSAKVTIGSNSTVETPFFVQTGTESQGVVSYETVSVEAIESDDDD